MSVRNKMAVAGVFASVAALTALGTGVAQAVTPEKPTADYQVCGNVLDSSGAGVAGVAVSGELYDSSDTVVTGAIASTTTNANGGYCLQGNSGMVGTVTSGGYVKLHAAGGNFGTWETNGIHESDFLSHIYVSIFPPISQSANGFNGTV
ncbi:carboxypeptidase-like regulatory domain-containing protein [Prescottella sp. R16]|uniref:carboxypeptidase-like regulatory domain-containing protein n=1 Tax=Prescottella sp. R16 TaxID=3064529 RepID=UPI00272DF076|nr:carboxypeptidase-like regulatory domain-containing protein [Prescottella sp. R16]